MGTENAKEDQLQNLILEELAMRNDIRLYKKA